MFSGHFLSSEHTFCTVDGHFLSSHTGLLGLFKHLYWQFLSIHIGTWLFWSSSIETRFFFLYVIAGSCDHISIFLVTDLLCIGGFCGCLFCNDFFDLIFLSSLLLAWHFLFSLLDCSPWEHLTVIFSAFVFSLVCCTLNWDSLFFFILLALLYIILLSAIGGRWSNFSFGFIKPNARLVAHDIRILPSFPAT